MRSISHRPALVAAVSLLAVTACGVVTTPSELTLSLSANDLLQIGNPATRQGAIAALGTWSLPAVAALVNAARGSTAAAVKVDGLVISRALTRASAGTTLAPKYPSLQSLWSSMGVNTELSTTDFSRGLDSLLHRHLGKEAAAFTPADYAVQANLLALLTMAITPPAKDLSLVDEQAYELGASAVNKAWEKINCNPSWSPTPQGVPPGQQGSINTQTDADSTNITGKGSNFRDYIPGQSWLDHNLPTAKAASIHNAYGPNEIKVIAYAQPKGWMPNPNRAYFNCNLKGTSDNPDTQAGVMDAISNILALEPED